jgi:hypothetical protein
MPTALCLLPYALCLYAFGCSTDGQLGLGAGELGWGLRCRHQVLPYASALCLMPYALCPRRWQALFGVSDAAIRYCLMPYALCRHQVLLYAYALCLMLLSLVGVSDAAIRLLYWYKSTCSLVQKYQ